MTTRRAVSLTLLLAAVGVAAPPAARAAVLATCGESRLEVTPVVGASATLRGSLAVPGATWRFSGKVAATSVGGRTRTVVAEDLASEEGSPRRGARAVPSQVFVDLFLDEGRVTLRHASEGGDDPEYAADLHDCRFPTDGDAVLGALVATPRETLGCAPATVRSDFFPLVDQAVRRAGKPAPTADVAAAASALCAAHQASIAARDRLTHAASDRAAHERTRAHGAAIRRAAETLTLALRSVDECLSRRRAAAPSPVAELEAAEARARACYDEVRARIERRAPARRGDAE